MPSFMLHNTTLNRRGRMSRRLLKAPEGDPTASPCARTSACHSVHSCTPRHLKQKRWDVRPVGQHTQTGCAGMAGHDRKTCLAPCLWSREEWACTQGPQTTTCKLPIGSLLLQHNTYGVLKTPSPANRAWVAAGGLCASQHYCMLLHGAHTTTPGKLTAAIITIVKTVTTCM